jgi:CubicO group peptidase (beta-lactamase class C family)
MRAVAGAVALTAFLAACAPAPHPPSPSPRRLVATDTLVVAPPRAVGMDRALHARLDSVLAAGIAYGAAPGAELAVGRYGRLVYMGGAGRLDPAPGSPAPDDSTLWDLASLTKVIGTTTAAMILQEEGKLSLDMPVHDYLPWLDAPDKAGITVRMLLEHRSGFRPDILFWKPTPGDSTPRQRIDADRLIYTPGDSMVYSDLNFILMGMIVQQLTGTTLDRFLAERVWGPLGMRDTGFDPLLPTGEEVPADSACAAALSHATPQRLARIAPTEVDTWYRHMHVHGIVHDENACALGGVAGHAGLFSSARDLAIFAQMMLNGGEYGGVRILHPNTIPRWTARQSEGSSRALGWDTPSPRSSAGRYFSPRAFGHTGFTGTSIWMDPQRGLFVILLTNRVDPTRANTKVFRLRREVADAVQSSILDAPLIDWEARR